ncbi:MAG TPA: SHOCT domain-containing protein [Vicinamibacteria bacterium]
MKIAAAAAALLGITMGTAASAAAETCSCPPPGSLSLSTSKDSKWRAKWCGNQSLVDTIWFGLNLDETGDLWDEGWGYEDVCNDNLFLSRLYNAGFIVREVQKIAPHFPENTSPNLGHTWWDFVHIHEDDGFEPRCCNDNLDPDECCLWATHYCCATSTDLCLGWGFWRGAADRSSTLVHEATHDDEGHIDDDACDNGGSCDTWYGAYNANTMQINYLYDAAAAYLVETVNNVKQRKVSIFQDSGKQMCGFIPLLEESERDTQLADVKNRLDSNFESGSVFPKYTDADDVDDAKDTPWECANCKTSDYTFSAQTYGDNKACNEITNKGNVNVNAGMRAACQAYNNKIATASGASAFGKIKADLYTATTGKCLGCSEQDTDAYCDTRKASATTVDDLDPQGMLSSCGYNYEDECLQEYCQEKFQASWASHAGDSGWDDPRGCLDAVCGNDATCRKLFLSYGGDPKYYAAGGCFGKLLACYDKHGFTIPGAGANPSPTEIKECEDQFAFCEAMEAIRRKILGYRMVNKWVHPSDPVTQRVNPWEKSAQEVFLGQLRQLKARLDRGTLTQAQFEQRLDRLMARPESQAVAFALEPRIFVGLLGSAQLEKIAAPSKRAVQPLALRATDVGARGRLLMRELEVLKQKAAAAQQKR